MFYVDSQRIEEMASLNFPVWEIEFVAEISELPLAYTFVRGTRDKAVWIPERQLPTSNAAAQTNSQTTFFPTRSIVCELKSGVVGTNRPDVIQFHGEPFRPPDSKRWKAAGIAMPVFSIRTR